MRAGKYLRGFLAVVLSVGLQSVQADNVGTGGTITYTDSSGLNPAGTPYVDGYVVHTFTSSGTYSNSFAVSADVLVVAGGGGGGNSTGGGGGAGGFIYTNAFPVSSGSNSVTVGAGGGGGTSSGRTGTNGANSVFGSLVAYGGGGGASNFGSTPNGSAGGSGGGASESGGAGTGGARTDGQGNVGGDMGAGWPPYRCGGGGGAGTPGTNSSDTVLGHGGAGLSSGISGTTKWYAGGGGGGVYNEGAGGSGGQGGGGTGGNQSSLPAGGPTDGDDNTGGGGGGQAQNRGDQAGSGGSGIVIIRYPYDVGALTVSVTSPTHGQEFLSGSSVTATVEVASGETNYWVTFYTNTVAAWSTNDSPDSVFTIELGALADGTYTNYATVTDGLSSNATSVTNTFTVAPDTTPPTPDPMGFADAPASLATNMIVMTASNATDALSEPVYYYFVNTTNGTNSGWISSAVWTNTGLTEGTTYGYKVRARDSATPSSNVTAYSDVFTAVPADPTVPPTDLYWTGAGTWGVDSKWATNSGGTYDQAWIPESSAFFEGTADTVTLGESINVSNLTINTTGYDIVQGASQNYVLSVAAGGGITAIITGNGTSITAGITNSPTVYIDPSNDNQIFALDPVGASMTLGAISVQSHGPLVNLGGSTTGNSVTTVTGAKIYKHGSSEWTLTGTASAYEHYITSGDLIVSGSGSLRSNSRAVKLSGGTLHYNNPGAVFNNAGSGPSGINDGDCIWITGGSIDNSSGAAITTSTYNPRMSWGSDWTFIGSKGTDSDLHIGTGQVGLFTSPTVTVNSNATFTVGGTVFGAYDLTKAGTGTLKLEGVNTYSGNTIVNAGTLSLGDGTANSSLDDGKDLRIAAAAGAKVELDFVGTDTVFAVLFDGVAGAAGTWGADGHATANHTTNALTGTGLLYSDGGVLTDTYLWDGGDIDIGGDGDAAGNLADGTWNTTTSNWDIGYVAHTNWGNTTADTAKFERGAAGNRTVTLGSDITLGEIDYQGTADTANQLYIGNTTEDNYLNFGGAALITSYNYYLTIRAGITGSPTIDYTSRSGDNNSALTLDPAASVSMTLGTVNISKNPGSQKNAILNLDGKSTGNSADSVTWSSGAHQLTISKLDTSTWTVGGFSIHGDSRVNVQSGTLVANGTWNPSHQFDVTGGTLGGTGTLSCTKGGATEIIRVLSGTIAPGDPTGTMTIADDCDIDGTLAITVNGAAVSTLAVDPTKTLDITGATLDVTVMSASGPVVIATYGSGQLSGNPFASDNLPTGWEIDYEANGGTAIILASPPAGTLVIIR